MIKIFKVFVALFISALLSSTVYAANHPVTGEKLAADQTFAYWALDEHSSIDPQIVEDVSGSDIIRDLFEGLLNQDADGNLIPGVAESCKNQFEQRGFFKSLPSLYQETN